MEKIKLSTNFQTKFLYPYDYPGIV